jgi:hypothetical protein
VYVANIRACLNRSKQRHRAGPVLQSAQFIAHTEVPMNGESGTALLRAAGIVSILLLVLAWLALDDITTDNATGAFIPEYSCLVVSGIWFAGLAVWLLVLRWLRLGAASVLALTLAVLAFWSLPHHYAPLSPVNYSGLISIAWFLVLAIWLVTRRAARPPTQVSTRAA